MPLPLTPSKYVALIQRDAPLTVTSLMEDGWWELHTETFDIHRAWPDIREEKG